MSFREFWEIAAPCTCILENYHDDENIVNQCKLHQHIVLTVDDPVTRATMQLSNTCYHNIMIVVVGKTARVREYVFTVKLNYSPFCGSILMRFGYVEVPHYTLLAY